MKPKNEIIISVNAGTDDAPDWQHLDMDPGEQFALELVNNLFTDISSITSSSTDCTIKIPRTVLMIRFSIAHIIQPITAAFLIGTMNADAESMILMLPGNPTCIF